MPQEISVSFQAVKTKVYKLIDAAIEGDKTETQIVESLERWWKQVHPADREVAQKHLLHVLERSHAGLNAMAQALLENASVPGPEKLGRPENGQAGFRPF